MDLYNLVKIEEIDYPEKIANLTAKQKERLLQLNIEDIFKAFEKASIEVK